VLKAFSDILLAIDAGDVCTGFAGSVCCLRHGRPQHPSSTTSDFVWYGRSSAALVPVVPGRPPLARSNRIHSIYSSCYCVRCTPRVGPRPYPFPAVYTAVLLSLIEGHGICPNLYADDTQIYTTDFVHRWRRCSFKTSFPLAPTTSLRGCNLDCS